MFFVNPFVEGLLSPLFSGLYDLVVAGELGLANHCSLHLARRRVCTQAWICKSSPQKGLVTSEMAGFEAGHLCLLWETLREDENTKTTNNTKTHRVSGFHFLVLPVG